jgi:hypothetical protein
MYLSATLVIFALFRSFFISFIFEANTISVERRLKIINIKTCLKIFVVCYDLGGIIYRTLGLP